ncbi:hypothetical protein [Mycobacteroides saopaulense]|uniref:hypothetical protein n=1 Tax=Mycobacteroides saopaulense TaxID=1578165 RepID=UPI0013F4E777|nr:hypothetical protein [Mycobacteroides saopaulense]
MRGTSRPGSLLGYYFRWWARSAADWHLRDGMGSELRSSAASAELIAHLVMAP